MRRFTLMLSLFVACAFSASTIQAQNVARKAVVLEVATGTWCTYCPGSSLGAKDLLDNGWPVVVIKNHDGDSYETNVSAARNNFYNVNSFPTSTFDGVAGFSGGNASSSIYTSYVPYVQTAMNQMTPMDINLSFTQSGKTIDATVDVEQVGTASGDFRVFFVVTESKIPESWLGQTEVSHVNRIMSPDQMGRAITISQGMTVSENFTVTLDSSWVEANIEFAAFVQDITTKQIYNATRLPLVGPSISYDQELSSVSNVPTGYTCDDTYAPQLLVRNNGADPIGSFDIDYTIAGSGGTTSGTYSWTGNLQGPLPIVVNIPAITYDRGLNTQFSAVMTNVLDVNGMPVVDSDSTNPTSYTQTSSWNYLERDGGDYEFEILTDNYGYETYWEIQDGAGTVLASGGNPTVGPAGAGAQVATSSDAGAYLNNTTYLDTVSLIGADCYKVLVIDDWGDGICCAVGNGEFTLRDPYGVPVLTGGQFGLTEEPSWGVTSTVDVDIEFSSKVSIFPNPSNGNFTVRVADLLEEGKIRVMALDGRTVFHGALNATEMDVNLGDIAAGTYMVTITAADKVTSKKINIR